MAVTSLGSNSNISTGTLTLTSVTVPAGALIVVAISEADSGATPGSASDSVGNTYTEIAKVNHNNTAATGYGRMYYVKNCTALGGGTITFTKGGTGRACIAAIYSDDRDTAAPLDTSVTATAFGSGSDGQTVTSGTPAEANELFVGVVTMTEGRSVTTIDAGNGWTAGPSVKSGGAGNDDQIVIGYQTNTGTGTKTYATSNIRAVAGDASFIFSFKAARRSLPPFSRSPRFMTRRF